MINLICDSHQSHTVGEQLGVKGDSTVLRGREEICGQNITGGGREGQGGRERGTRRAGCHVAGLQELAFHVVCM